MSRTSAADARRSFKSTRLMKKEAINAIDAIVCNAARQARFADGARSRAGEMNTNATITSKMTVTTFLQTPSMGLLNSYLHESVNPIQVCSRKKTRVDQYFEATTSFALRKT